LPDGNFPTAPYPNPEIREAFACALKTAEEVHPDIIIATDPDSDRAGTAVLSGDEYKLLGGNEIGMLLFNYIFENRKKLGTLPQNPVAVKSIVSTDICKKIAAQYGCELRDVLTGFKFIGEQITELEKIGQVGRYVFGFEESFGYLPGPYVRDKDAVGAAMLICEMAAFYKEQGLNLLEVLEGIYKRYGYYLSAQKSFTCEGQAGMKQIASIMESIRNNPPKSIGSKSVSVFKDINTSVETILKTGEQRKISLPKSNVLIFEFGDGATIIVRPSGTEPKIKIYVCAVAPERGEAEQLLCEMVESGTKLLGF
ncbi:MAG: phospho-sugar mutase, partial [Clostridia bacterium]|nr:phospho-sugar mutase [Clostridia bacterium]